MNLLVPVDKNHKISSISDKVGWAFVSLENGSKIDEKIYKSKSDIDEMLDYVVIKDKNEDIDDFLDEDIGVLIAPFQEEVDDVIEAFMFRELYELGS